MERLVFIFFFFFILFFSYLFINKKNYPQMTLLLGQQTSSLFLLFQRWKGTQAQRARCLFPSPKRERGRLFSRNLCTQKQFHLQSKSLQDEKVSDWKEEEKERRGREKEHGKVKVILCGGGLGESEMNVMSLLFSSKSGCPGKREAVCPSGPIPLGNQR